MPIDRWSSMLHSLGLTQLLPCAMTPLIAAEVAEVLAYGTAVYVEVFRDR